ncbi:MAG: thiamine-phosphate kinase [Pseudomonadota bacterium]
MFERLKLQTGPNATVAIEPGDDSNELLISVDTMVPGVHYWPEVNPTAIGAKLAAVNLSDIAAMGGDPVAATLHVTGLDPQAPRDALWLANFADGLNQTLDAHRASLAGTTIARGPVTLTLQIYGRCPPGRALRRDGARADDALYVSGTLGDAALALALELLDDAGGLEATIAARLHRPTPRVAIGRALRGHATAAIDLSDGLAGDLGHICAASQLGAVIEPRSLPRSAAFDTLVGARDPLALCLSGGDDYELLFTAPSASQEALSQIAARHECPLTRIGYMTNQRTGVWLESSPGRFEPVPSTSYDHFAGRSPD